MTDPVPAMPVIRESEKYTSNLPYPLLDGMPRVIGWQWGGKDGPAFVIVARGALGGLKVQERYPLTEDGWHDAWRTIERTDPAAISKIAAVLERRAAEDARKGPAVLSAPPPPRFPSSPHTRRAILEMVARSNEKYARPFDRGKLARASVAGTTSWAEYGDTVLQMAILDTLLSIEDKLGALLRTDQDVAQVNQDLR